MTSAMNYRNARTEDVTGNNARNGGDKTMRKLSSTRVRGILFDNLIGMRQEEAHKGLIVVDDQAEQARISDQGSGQSKGERQELARRRASAHSRVLYGRVTVVQILADIAFLPCEWRLRIEVVFAFVGVICELVLFSLGLCGQPTGDERGMWGRAVGGQRLERLRDTHHEFVRDLAETLDLAFKLSNFALKSIVLLLNVKDVRTG